MKKGVKIILIVAAVLLLLGVAICIAAFGIGADPLQFFTDGTYSVSFDLGEKNNGNDPGRDGQFGQRGDGVSVEVVEGEGSYSVDAEIKKISIDWISGSVKIVRGGEKNITFSESAPKGIDAENKLFYTVEGDTLKIECCKDKKITIGFDFDSGYKELVVYVPYTLEGIYVDTTSADVEADGLEILDKLYVSTTSGDFVGTNMSCGDVELGSTSGSLFFTGSCRDFNANSTSGQVVFTGSARDLEADTTSGEVRFILNELPAELSADTSSGEVTMYLPPDASFELEYDTSSGDFNCDFPVLLRDGDYVVGGGGAEIDVDTTSGGLSVMIYGERMP